MANFYASYPANNISSSALQTVQGEGTPGSQLGGLLTIQGDPSGTPIPISGSITATNPSVAATGAAVPADATYIGMSISGTLTGLTGTASGLNTVINAAIPAGANTIGAVTQASGPWTQNITQFGSSNISTGTGAGGAGIPRVTVSNDSSLASVTTVSTVTAVTAITNALPAGSNIIGKTGIDQTTPGTTNGIQATSGTTATWQAEGSIAAGSITSSYQTVFTPSASTKILYMRNNTNASVTVSMDAGTTINWVLDAGDQVSTDFVANGLLSTTAAIQIKSAGSPSTGSFRVNGCH